MRFSRRALLGLPVLLFGLIWIPLTSPARAADNEAAQPLKLKVGDVAPDFELLAYDGKGVTKVALHDYRGKKNVALAFYVFAFTGG